MTLSNVRSNSTNTHSIQSADLHFCAPGAQNGEDSSAQSAAPESTRAAVTESADAMRSAAFATESAAGNAVAVKATYADCLLGRAPVPKVGDVRKIAFTFFMVLGMCSIMVTFNGVLHSGLAFFKTAHWMYPTAFAIAFMLRLFLVDGLVDSIIGRMILPHTRPGALRGVLITVANIVLMVPLMSGVMSVLLSGFTVEALASLRMIPLVAVVAFCVNTFVVGPAVKMLYNNVLVRAGGFDVINNMKKAAAPLLAFFGC